MSAPQAKPLISPATFLAPSRFLSNTPTWAPYSAKRRQIAEPIAPAPPVTITFLPFSPRTVSSVLCHPERSEGSFAALRMTAFLDGRVGIELGLALLEVGSEAFLHLGTHEAQHLERGRGVERRPHHAQPVVQRVLGEADRGLRALGELGRDLQAL